MTPPSTGGLTRVSQILEQSLARIAPNPEARRAIMEGIMRSTLTQPSTRAA